MSGWALAPLDGSARVGLALNGHPMEVLEWGAPRKDIADLFWFWPGAADSGFRVRYAARKNRMCRRGPATIEYVDLDTGVALNPLHSFFLPDPRNDLLPLPDGARRARVQGTSDENVFRIEGFTAFAKLVAALQPHLRESRQALRWLDWGCGCGRLSRYLIGMKKTHVTGVDIDADNAAWCAANLGAGDFFVVPTEPPCVRLMPQSFDAVIGMSVMTHLAEADQIDWLTELARVMRPGAVAALTAHGGPTIAKSPMEYARFGQYLNSGFVDGGQNPDLAGAIEDETFYRNVFNSPAHIARFWTEHFTVVQHIVGAIGNHQDIVVLRRKL